MTDLAFRLDDVGACSKRYEVYSDCSWGVGPVRVSANWLWFKYVHPWKKWGPYRELTAQEWGGVVRLLEGHHAKLTVAVTAGWAEREDRVIPFPVRFPAQAAALKAGVERGVIEIANHGLTHCVLQDNAFKPRWFTGNRTAHREFWDWVPLEEQERHLRESQDILQGFFRQDVVTFVPPGHVFSEATLAIAERYGLRYVSCRAPQRAAGRMLVLGEEGVAAFHDRDLVLHGLDWLADRLRQQAGKRSAFVRELGEALQAQIRQERTASPCTR